MMPDPEAPKDERHSQVKVGDVQGGIQGSIFAGRDANLVLNIVQQSGGPPPSLRNQPALLESLQQTLPHLTHPAEKATTQAAIEKLQQALTALPQHEQDFLTRVRNRYAKPATVFVEVAAEAYEHQSPAGADSATLDLAAVADLMRDRETMPNLEEWQVRGQQIQRVQLASLRQATERYNCIILLGDPGSGKTTALNHLAYHLASEVGANGHLPLPLVLRLSEFGPGQSVEDFIVRGWRGSADSDHWDAPDLAANLEGYLEQGRLFILFDALNEMPAAGFSERATALRDFIEQWQPKGNRFVVTCRVLDYEQELQGLQRVEMRPFSDAQIQKLLQKVLHRHWPKMWAALTEGNGSSETANRKSLLEMARNPYVLTMMVSEFVRQQGRLSRNRAELMTGFTQTLLGWAKRKSQEAWLSGSVQQAVLSVTAFEMQQRAGSGAAVESDLVKTVMPTEVQTDPNFPPVPSPPDQILTLAARANIIEMPVDRSSVRFYHQLLQEYFAAREMLRRMVSPSPQPSPSGRGSVSSPPQGGTEGDLEKLWRWPWWLEKDMPLWKRPENNYDPLPAPPQTNWEETTILAAGLAPENDTQLVRALIAINPLLAGRCLYEGQAKVDQVTRQAVIKALLTTIAQPEVALRVRIAAGDTLGYLGDPRLGALVTIPAGEFVMGEDNEQHELDLPEYQIGKYPMTNAEFGRFIEARGYQEKRWWTDAGWKEKEESNWAEPRYWDNIPFNKPNRPVVGVSWYEAVAYCRWLSAESGRAYRLPTEAEWEKAARGPDGRVYPWGSEFEASRLNVGEGEQQVRATTPVGIYPSGVSPTGVYDSAGNVWEWCATKRGKAYPYNAAEDEWSEAYLEGTDGRVLRGGSWGDDWFNARCAYRDLSYPSDWLDFSGLRVMVSPSI